MQLPEYGHNSLVNLAAALRLAAGGAATGGHAPLPLPAAVLSARHIVLLLVDGLGYNAAQRAGGLIARHLHARLTSVFPTTTASAITSLYTAATPGQHGITGWFTWLRELGSVAAVLPFTSRSGGLSYAAAGVQPRDVIGARSLFFDTVRPCHVVNPARIAGSAYSRTLSGPAARHAFSNLEELEQILARLAREPGITFAYYPELDALAHSHGLTSPEVAQCLTALELMLGRVLDRLAGCDAVLLLTADHGMVDTTPDRIVDVAEHPALASDLVLPLCGEPRAAYAYVHPDRSAHFEEYVRVHLGHCCTLYPRAQLLAENWFGPGDFHPEFVHRIGDYLLLMQDNYVVAQTLPREKPFSQRAVHGGLNAEELYVPLALFVP